MTSLYLWAASGTEIYKSQSVLTGIYENTAHKENVKIFPNPFKDNLIIELTNNLNDGESIRISIYSIDGKLQKTITDKVSDNQIIIGLNNLTEGPYIISIAQRGFITNSLIIKE